MVEFMNFWGNCLVEGWHWGNWAIGIIEVITLLIWGVLFRRKKLHRQCVWWEEKLRKLSFWIFISTFLMFGIFYAPFKEHQSQEARFNTEQDLHYITANRPYLEPELVIFATESNHVGYYFEIKNNGNLPASAIKIEQISPDFKAPDFVTNRFLAPKGRMSTVSGLVALPTRETPLNLYLKYLGDYGKTNLVFESHYLFSISKNLGRYPYLQDEPEGISNITGEKNPTNQNELFSQQLQEPNGGFTTWYGGDFLFMSSSDRMFVYDLKSKTAIFKSVLADHTPTLLHTKIDTNLGSVHLIAISWNTNGAMLSVDTNLVSTNWSN